MLKNKPLGSFIEKTMKEKGLSVLDLSQEVRCSTRTIYDMLRGGWENRVASVLRKNSKSSLPSKTLVRVLSALGEDWQPWLERLNLPEVNAAAVLSRPQRAEKSIFQRPLSAEDIEWFARVQREVGVLFTLEMAATLLRSKVCE